MAITWQRCGGEADRLELYGTEAEIRQLLLDAIGCALLDAEGDYGTREYKAARRKLVEEWEKVANEIKTTPKVENPPPA